MQTSFFSFSLGERVCHSPQAVYVEENVSTREIEICVSKYVCNVIVFVFFSSANFCQSFVIIISSSPVLHFCFSLVHVSFLVMPIPSLNPSPLSLSLFLCWEKKPMQAEVCCAHFLSCLFLLIPKIYQGNQVNPNTDDIAFLSLFFL